MPGSVRRDGSIRHGPPAPVNTPGTPVLNSIRPVRMLYRLGVHTVAGLCASVKLMPSAASRSMFGVGTFDAKL